MKLHQASCALTVAVVLSGCQLTGLTQKAEQAPWQPTAEECFAAAPFAADKPSCADVEAPQSLIAATEIESAEHGDVEVIAKDVPEVPLVVNDVWQRVRMQLDMPIPDNDRILAQQRWYLQHPDYMQRVNNRAAPFLYLIVEEIEKQQMPLELALLPIVESAFDPFAYSHGRAAGMWQFIPGTGKRFGLKQTWWYDGRRDVLASTQGALAYLSYLHDMFDGDWLLAIAAYNSGEGRVQKAVKKNQRAGKPTDFWSLDLPRETRAYVPKLLALADMLKRSEELAFNWPMLENRPAVEVVDTGSQIDLALAAELAGLTVEELHALNPGYNRWATDPKGPHHLLLPIDRALLFRTALENSEERPRLNWVRHQVKNGDSLLKLAKQYHTSVDVIRNMNQLRGNIIRAGDHLMIPVALKSLDSYALSVDERLQATQATPRGSYSVNYEVRPGDTLWDISREYKVNVRSLAKWNGMAPTDPLRPGKNLVIWLKDNQQANPSAVVRSLTYTVRNGDSLARIASRFNVRIADIEKWNSLNRQKYLQPGQRLKLYVDVTRT